MTIDTGADTFFDDTTAEAEHAAQAELLALINSSASVKTREYKTGEAVKGTVLSVGAEFVFLDIGAKNEAVIRVSEYLDAEGKPTVKGGDTLEAFISSAKDDEIILSKSPMGKGRKVDISDLLDALSNRTPVDGRITGVNKGGFNVNILDGKRAFCPFSQVDMRYNGEPNSYLTKTLQFVITKVEENGRNIVLSRLPLLEKDLGARLAEITALAGSGTTVGGTVTRIQSFGLFVDIGNGFEGLVHISEVSWDRTENLEALFSANQPIDVVVLKVEERDPLRDSRISLSIKQASANPWSSVSEKLAVGTSVEGRITRLMNFGAFVSLLPGVEALIPISEMTWGRRIKHPSDVLAEGQPVTVTILAIDDLKRNISCSLKDAANDPWAGAAEKFVVGTLVTGTVASEQKYGFFVDLDESITGLLPHVRIGQDKKGKVRKGEAIEVRIDNVDTAARRIGLSYGDVGAAEADEQGAREYMKMQKQEQYQPAAAAAPGNSDFADMLKAALSKKTKV